MSAKAPALTRTWKVGRRLATLTVSTPDDQGRRAAVIEWDPEVPATLNEEELAEYRRGRDAALKSLGLAALVIET